MKFGAGLRADQQDFGVHDASLCRLRLRGPAAVRRRRPSRRTGPHRGNLEIELQEPSERASRAKSDAASATVRPRASAMREARGASRRIRTRPRAIPAARSPNDPRFRRRAGGNRCGFRSYRAIPFSVRTRGRPRKRSQGRSPHRVVARTCHVRPRNVRAQGQRCVIHATREDARLLSVFCSGPIDGWRNPTPTPIARHGERTRPEPNASAREPWEH
jgi:hypothetical protein